MLKVKIYYVLYCVFFPEVITDIVILPYDMEVHANCSNKEKIAISNISIVQMPTTCSERPCNSSNLLGEVRNICDGNTSCTLADKFYDGCLQKYGYVDFSYICKVKAFTCDFEERPSCNFEVRDNGIANPYKWLKVKGVTPSSNTGPDTDHSTYTDDGFYIYAEATRGELGDHTQLISDWIMPNYDQCLSFWYHMYGENIGTLIVYQTIDNMNMIHLWNISFDQGNIWHNKRLALSEKYIPYKLVFEATRGDDYKGDIAIDDIEVTNTQCDDSANINLQNVVKISVCIKTAMSLMLIVSVSLINCNFETLCSWTLDDNRKYHWTIKTGNTRTSGTGPSVDHTTDSDKGHYTYLEASNISKNSRANLTSQAIIPSTESCFSFWYHMEGTEIGQLAVYIDTHNNSKIVWLRSGNQGSSWLQTFVDISSQQRLKIVFEGTRGGNKGDIAVDDIVFSSGPCSGLIRNENTCLRTDMPIQPSKCSNHYIVFDQYNITYHPNVDECSEFYRQLQPTFRENCLHSDKTECFFNFSDAFDKRPDCFHLSNITVQYTCEHGEGIDSSKSNVLKDTSELQIPAIFGATIGIMLIIFGVVGLILFFANRYRNMTTESKFQLFPDKIKTNHGRENAISSVLYNVAEPDIGPDDCYINTKNTITISAHGTQLSEFVDNPTKLRLSIAQQCQDISEESTLDTCQLKPDRDRHVEYANYTPSKVNGDIAFGEDKCTTNTNVVLNPDDTEDAGSNDIIETYDKNHKDDLSDPYVTSQDGTYDTTTNIVQKDLDQNVYSRTVDDIYDTANHERHISNDDNYEHFSTYET